MVGCEDGVEVGFVVGFCAEDGEFDRFGHFGGCLTGYISLGYEDFLL